MSIGTAVRLFSKSLVKSTHLYSVTVHPSAFSKAGVLPFVYQGMFTSGLPRFSSGAMFMTDI